MLQDPRRGTVFFLFGAKYRDLILTCLCSEGKDLKLNVSDLKAPEYLSFLFHLESLYHVLS